MCYSDLPYLYTGRGFAELNWPYTDDAQVRARYQAMEYPVGIAYFAYGAALGHPLARAARRTSSARYGRRRPTWSRRRPGGHAEIAAASSWSPRCGCAAAGAARGLVPGRGATGAGPGTRRSSRPRRRWC